MKRCPDCDIDNQDSETYCRCGKLLRGPDIAAEPAPLSLHMADHARVLARAEEEAKAAAAAEAKRETEAAAREADAAKKKKQAPPAAPREPLDLSLCLPPAMKGRDDSGSRGR